MSNVESIATKGVQYAQENCCEVLMEVGLQDGFEHIFDQLSSNFLTEAEIEILCKNFQKVVKTAARMY